LVYEAAPAVEGAVTCTLIVQVPGLLVLPPGMAPAVSVTVRGKVVAAVPPQVVVADPFTTVSTVPGKVSEMLTPVKAEAVGFCSVTVNTVVSPA